MGEFHVSRCSFLTSTGAVPSVLRAAATAITKADEELLDDLSRRCFQYFQEQSDPRTGIARDRARADASEYPANARYDGSTGATGFALTAFFIGAERGWISHNQARERVRAALNSYAIGPVKDEHGWFYHFVDIRNGEQYRNSEVSTSDSTWLAAGALTARHYFREDPQIVELSVLLVGLPEAPGIARASCGVV